MTHRLLWLLVPVAAGLGYWTVPQAAALRTPASEAPPQEEKRITKWVRQLEHAGSDQLPELLDKYLAMEPGQDRDFALRLLCARWAEVDPKGALVAFTVTEVTPGLRWRLLTEWALLDSDAAWAAIAAGKDGDQDRAVVTEMLLHEDPDVFMGWFRKTKALTPDDDPAWLAVAERHGKELEEIAVALAREDADERLKSLVTLLARSRATKDPEAGLQWASQLDPKIRTRAMRAVLDEWSLKDPLEVWKRISGDEAEKLAEAAKLGFPFDSLRGKILKSLIKESPEAAMKLVLETGSPETRMYSGDAQTFKEAFGSALAAGKMKGIDAYRLISSAKGSDSSIGLNAFHNLWRGMSEENLEQTFREVIAEPAEQNKGTALGGIANAWAIKDPEAAFAFIAKIENPVMKAEAYAGCLREGNDGHVDPQRLAEIFGRIPESDRAMAFATEMSNYGEPEVGEDPMNSAAPRFHPELLAPLFANLPASEALKQSAAVLALRWGEEDPAAALAWAKNLDDPATRSAAYEHAVDGWAFHDPYAAGTWLSKQAKGPERDAATLPFIRHLSRSDASKAWEWTDSIGNPSLRMDARVSALREWASVDSAAAQSAYQEIAAKLPAADAAKLSSCFSAK